MDMDTIVRLGLILLALIAVVVAMLSTRGYRSRSKATRRVVARPGTATYETTSQAGFWAWSDSGGGSDSTGGDGGGG